MEIKLIITKEDIKTLKCKNNCYELVLSNNIRLNFTPEAIEEFYSDFKSFEKDDEEIEAIIIDSALIDEDNN